MTFRIAGLCSALAAAALAFWIGTFAAANLPGSRALLALFTPSLVAAVVGYLAGSAVWRRAARSRERLITFSALAGSVSGGIVGATCGLTLTVLYFATYMTWPAERLQQALALLSYPAFALLGMCLGAMTGLILGAVAGSALRIATVRR